MLSVLKSSVMAPTLTASLLIALVGSATAQSYPTKSMRLIVPFTTGGATDAMARLVATKLTDKWGQSMIVDNRPGGNSIIGTDAVAKASPDGYTFLLASANFVTSPNLLTLPYDTIKDFAPVGTIAKYRFLLVLNPSLPANSLKEFIALAKSKPEQINFASPGVGSGGHLAFEMLNMVAGIKLPHVPYKGAGQIIPDQITGRVQMSLQIPVAVLSHIKSGKLKAVAITGESRLGNLPQVPTFAEGGISGYGREAAGWFGIVAPARTPKAIIEKMSSEMAAILAAPDVKEHLVNLGNEPFILSPEQFAALIKADIAKFAKVIKAANIKVQK